MKKRKEHLLFIFGLVSGSEGEKTYLRERERVQLLSRFPGIRIVGSRWSKRRSWSTLQGLHVDTDFVEFRQLREVGVFSYLVISCLKAMTMVLGVVRPRRATNFDSKKWNQCMMRGAVHGQPTD